MSFTIRGLAWDTEYFGYPCASADILGKLDENDVTKLRDLSRQYRFVTIHNPDALAANEQTLLTLPNTVKTDVNVRLCNDGLMFAPMKMREDFRVSLAGNLTLSPDVFEAVRGSFTHSRFYQDGHISKEQADGVFDSWLKNAQNRPDKYFCLCSVKKRCAGVMLLSQPDGNGSVTIELLSVSSEFQGLGIGTAMMSRLGDFCRQTGASRVYVGTQKRNAAALAFYKKNHFTLDKETHIYHMWND